MAAKVTLTFDNGPTPEVTGPILDLLAERGIRTTFFVVGDRLGDPRQRALMERASAEGHWIGNHTFSHSVPLGASTVRGAAVEEIRSTQDLLGGVSHVDKLFRPFGEGGRIGDHLLNPEAAGYLLAEGFTCVLWTTVPHDWDEPLWVEVCLDDIGTRDWSVVVVHDLPDCCLARLPELLDGLQEKDATVVQEFPESVVPIRRGIPTTDLQFMIRDTP